MKPLFGIWVREGGRRFFGSWLIDTTPHSGEPDRPLVFFTRAEAEARAEAERDELGDVEVMELKVVACVGGRR